MKYETEKKRRLLDVPLRRWAAALDAEGQAAVAALAQDGRVLFLMPNAAVPSVLLRLAEPDVMGEMRLVYAGGWQLFYGASDGMHAIVRYRLRGSAWEGEVAVRGEEPLTLEAVVPNGEDAMTVLLVRETAGRYALCACEEGDDGVWEERVIRVSPRRPQLVQGVRFEDGRLAAVSFDGAVFCDALRLPTEDASEPCAVMEGNLLALYMRVGGEGVRLVSEDGRIWRREGVFMGGERVRALLPPGCALCRFLPAVPAATVVRRACAQVLRRSREAAMREEERRAAETLRERMTRAEVRLVQAEARIAQVEARPEQQRREREADVAELCAQVEALRYALAHLETTVRTLAGAGE